MTITNVDKVADRIRIVKDGLTSYLTVVGEDIPVSVPISGKCQVANFYVDEATSKLYVAYHQDAWEQGSPSVLELVEAGVGAGDMLKSTYDTDDDGVVDNSDKLEGSTKAEVQDHTPKAHTASHTDGTDDVRDATNALKGLATAAQITKLEGIATGATVYPDTGEQAFLDADHTKLDGIDTGADVTADNAPQVHKDSHDPEDGGDKLDCAAAGEIVGVAAAAEGSAHSFARSDHTHQVQHSIANNHIVTVDQADAATGEYAKFTADGLESKSKTEQLSDLNVADGADVTGSNAPQAHKASHQNGGGDEVSVTGLSGLLADDQHVLDAEAVAACEAAGLSLATGKRINIISVLTSDQTWSGITATLQAGENLTIGQLVYMKSDGKMWKAQADAASTAIPAVAIATGTINAEAHGEFLLAGFFREDSVFTFTAGAILYVSDTAAGAFDETAPADTTEMVQRVGICFPTVHIIYFKPDLTVCEVA